MLTAPSTPLTIEPGRTHPLGATPDAEGVNFSLFSLNATAVWLLLFEHEDDPLPTRTIELNPLQHKTFYFWHAYVRGLKPGAVYAYRVDGPQVPEEGLYFDPQKVLLDPYGRGLTDLCWQRSSAIKPGDNVDTSLRNVVVETSGYDWEGVQPPRTPMRETVIYEMHVGGFTRSPSAGVANPGTFSAIIEKIPYLQSLGVTAVELLPVFAFDETDVDRVDPTTGEPLCNYWGYNSLAFFTPHNRYAVYLDERRQFDEFRDMVKALHRAGIEVILDVVFNHTSEGDHRGPTISLKGIDAPIYYHQEPTDRRYFRDFSGCGNTLKCNHPVVQKLIIDCLKFWSEEMGVDGFRFDEGSILSRGDDGAPMPNPPLTWAIELDDAFRDKKLITEAWDAAGLYQVGYFPGRRWAEWNGHYRDDVRRFLRGDRGLVGAVASRIAGSADVYHARKRFPINSINFITCHDGFTLNDLFSYNEKHNEANGEGNRDGANDNQSWNHGVEGPSDDPEIEALRRRQVLNACAVLMLSQGVPMLLSGDELRRSQGGNNNAYCQNNETSWFDWSAQEARADVFAFFAGMIALRKRHRCLTQGRYFTGQVGARGLADLAWHGCDLHQPGFDDPHSGVLAYTLRGLEDDPDLHVIFNMEDQPLGFALPTVPGRRWHRVVDTSLETAIVEEDAAPRHEAGRYTAGPRSVVVLVAR